ncbi:hypothetical protein IMG5_016870, partial [Ichthyophthirius multifiliis]
ISTFKGVQDELAQILLNNEQSSQVVQIILQNLIENIPKNAQKEYIQLFGLVSQIYQQKLLEFYPKILQFISKQIISNENNHLNSAISTTLGQFCQYTIKSIQDQEYLISIINLVSQHLIVNKTMQVSAMCLQGIIQSSPLDCILNIKDDLVIILINQAKSGHFITEGAQESILMALLALIICIEEQFRPYAKNIVPILVQNLVGQTARKITIDMIYTLGVLMGEELEQYLDQIVELVKICRCD